MRQYVICAVYKYTFTFIFFQARAVHRSEALSKRECASHQLEVLNKHAPSRKQGRGRTGVKGQIYLHGLEKPSFTLVVYIGNQQLFQIFTLRLFVHFRVRKFKKVKSSEPGADE